MERRSRRRSAVDRELHELLEEIRVAIPGAEVLFAFLLGVAFTNRFAEASTLQRNTYFATLLLTAAATALLIAPSAYHRLHFRDGDKTQLLFTATRMVLASLVLLLFAVAGVVFLVGDVVYSSRAAALAQRAHGLLVPVVLVRSAADVPQARPALTSAPRASGISWRDTALLAAWHSKVSTHRAVGNGSATRSRRTRRPTGSRRATCSTATTRSSWSPRWAPARASSARTR